MLAMNTASVRQACAEIEDQSTVSRQVGKARDEPSNASKKIIVDDSKSSTMSARRFKEVTMSTEQIALKKLVPEKYGAKSRIFVELHHCDSVQVATHATDLPTL